MLKIDFNCTRTKKYKIKYCSMKLYNLKDIRFNGITLIFPDIHRKFQVSTIIIIYNKIILI